MKLSKHFTLEEMTATMVRDITNTPSLDEAENLRFLCEHVLEPVREQFGPMHTTSGFRSKSLNVIIGGSKTSMHTRGCAWDGVPLREGVKFTEVIEWIRASGVPFDQVIYEFGRWIHIGTRTNGEYCRREALMIFTRGKYEVWNPLDSRIIR